MRKLLFAIAVMLVHAGAMGQVYKWVDDKGVTHYDQKPPENTKSKEVPIHSGATSTGPAPNLQDMQSKDQAFRKRQAQREQDEAKAARERDEHEKKCAQMTTRIADMQRSRRLYNSNEKGEREYLDDDQRQAALAKSEEDYNQNCK